MSWSYSAGPVPQRRVCGRAIKRTMQILDMYCHMARWQPGDVQAMIPEVEQS
jgi:hypothetical protein